MTQEQINELRKLAQAATPGPWEVRAGVLRKIGEQSQIATIYRPYNSQFIAAANPAAVLAMIQQRDKLLAALKDCATEEGPDQDALNRARAAIAKAEG